MNVLRAFYILLTRFSFHFQNLKNQIMTTNLWVEQVRILILHE